MDAASAILSATFPKVWETLSDDAQRLIIDDVRTMVADGDAETFALAARVLRRRIGGIAPLKGYGDCLVAGERRRDR